MIVFIIILYLLFGLCIACIYNALHAVPFACDMSEEDKHRMFIITCVWPIWLTVVFVKELISCIKWLFNKNKSKK